MSKSQDEAMHLDDSASDDGSSTDNDPSLPGDGEQHESPTSSVIEVIAQPEDGPKEEIRLVDARAYQREMFDLSLKHNSIVVMPTGSGKTQV